MTKWQKPSFEDLEMNAEIGGYQSDDWSGDRDVPPFAHDARDWGTSRVADLVAEFLGSRVSASQVSASQVSSPWPNEIATGHG